MPLTKSGQGRLYVTANDHPPGTICTKLLHTPRRGREGKGKGWGKGRERDGQGKRRGGGKGEKGMGWTREGGKVTGNGRDGTGQGMGREGKGRGGKGRRGATARSPKLQFRAPPLVNTLVITITRLRFDGRSTAIGLLSVLLCSSLGLGLEAPLDHLLAVLVLAGVVLVLILVLWLLVLVLTYSEDI